ncbi:hypothetical protein EG329_009702 [Mollisiaceae sp. DMI_Dod_QoI]|nr:hypothetical protein EG329_009702 [Helotiales sp. DMI_Dod_QoI]
MHAQDCSKATSTIEQDTSKTPAIAYQQPAAFWTPVIKQLNAAKQRPPEQELLQQCMGMVDFGVASANNCDGIFMDLIEISSNFFKVVRYAVTQRTASAVNCKEAI